MRHKIMMAALMTASALGGVAPAMAQDGSGRWTRYTGVENRAASRPDRTSTDPANNRQRDGSNPVQDGDRSGWRGQRDTTRPGVAANATVTAPVPSIPPPAANNWRNNSRTDSADRQERRAQWQRRSADTPAAGAQPREERIDNDRHDHDRDARWSRDGRAGGNANAPDARRVDRDWHDYSRWQGNNTGWNSTRGWRDDNDRNWRNDRDRHDDWNRSWRNDRRYDWRDWRNQYRDRFQLGRYYAPHGWDYGYRRFSIGLYLDALLISNNYWITDPYTYHLPPAYGPLRWVRYYDDALLVDVRNGYVVDVIYDVFW